MLLYSCASVLLWAAQPQRMTYRSFSEVCALPSIMGFVESANAFTSLCSLAFGALRRSGE